MNSFNKVLLFLSLVLFGAVFLVPILLGLGITILSSFNFDGIDNLDKTTSGLTFQIWKDFFVYPQTKSAIFITFFTSTAATLLTVLITFFLGSFFYLNFIGSQIEKRFLPFLLSIPHSTFAIGLIFLIAPSGFLFRVLNIFFNWDSPPQVITYQDPQGIALILSLVIREVPFLMFIMIASLSQIKTKSFSFISQSMGYSQFKTWTRVIWPQLYPRMKLAIFVVLAYSLAPIDMSLIIGPNNPPNLIVLILEWFNEPNLHYKKVASAGTLFILAMLLSQIFIWRMLERVVGFFFDMTKINGERGKSRWYMPALAYSTLLIIFGSMLISFLLNLVWSFSRRWPFPDIIPQNFSLMYWERILILDSESYILSSLIIGLGSTFLSIVFSLIFLETEKKYPFLRRVFTYSIYFPLLIPSVIFLFGIYLFYLYLDFDFIYLKIILVHVLFVVPYIFISLRDNYHRYDDRYSIVAKSFGKNSFLVYLRVKAIILSKPLLFAVAIGFSVSFAEYLSTIWIGEGRVSTITTEAVNLSGGSNRSIIGAFAFLQILLPLMFFSFSLYWSKKLNYKL